MNPELELEKARLANINTDGGRVCRPFYIVNDNKILLTKDIVTDIKSGNKK